VRENAKAGNYGGCSFGFEVIRDSWVYDKDDDVDERTLLEVKLHEISVCTFPAYADGTSVTARDQVGAAMEARDAYYEREYETWADSGVSEDDERANKAPYGNVVYADPGLPERRQKKVPD
jgi:phage head maturation protease